MPVVRVKEKYQVTLPSKVREALGVEIGDFLEAEAEKGRIVLKPKALVDKGIDEALEDVKAGRVYGPFDTAEETMKFLKQKTKKR
jgi:AbrB family looped-hinge helix DNA binding protein